LVIGNNVGRIEYSLTSYHSQLPFDFQEELRYTSPFISSLPLVAVYY